MAEINDAILQAIASLTQECREGFERVEASQKDQDKRIQKVETDVVRIKTVWAMASVILGFVIHAAKDWFLGSSTK